MTGSDQNKYKLVITIGIHLVIWPLFFYLNFLFLDSFNVSFDFLYHLKVWSVYILVFFINYYLLFPYLFFKKFFYPLSFSILFIAGTFLIRNKTESEKFNFAEKANKSLESKKISKNQSFGKTVEFNSHALPSPGIEIISLYGLLLVFTASISLRIIHKWQEDEKLKTENEKEKVSTELSFLKHQINPHFLFNALNNIYSLTLNTSTKASGALLKLSSILRYMLYETENTDVLLKDELSIIGDFVELQKIRITEKVKVKYQIIGNPGSFKIAPLLLIPIIENAFKHGVDNVHDSFIEIVVKIESGQLQLAVKNKIVNIRLEKDNNTGIGIKNIKRRLDLLYPEKYSFDADEKNSIFNVELKLNLNA